MTHGIQRIPTRNPYEEIKEDLEEMERVALEPLVLLKKIDSIKGGNTGINEIRDKAFASFLYLTGCRIEECVKYIREIARYPEKEREEINKKTGKVKGEYIIRKDKKGKEYLADKREWIGEPILRGAISDFHDHILVKGVRNLKRKWNDKAKSRPVPIFKGELEMPFIKHLNNYIKKIDDPDYRLFDFTRQHAFEILKDVKINPHQLRHTRITHLCTFYPFSLFDLQNFVAWKSVRSADDYVHLTKEDILVKFRYVGAAKEK